MAHEQEPDIVFNRGEVYRFAVHSDGLGLIVQDNPTDHQLAGLLLQAAQCGIPAQLGADPGKDLDGVEGLGDVVVRPHIEPQHLVGILALGSQQDDGYVAFLPQLGGGGDAVHLRHHDIHEDEMELVLVGDLQSLTPRICLKECVAFRGEIDFQSGDNVPLIVADQNICHIGLLPPFRRILSYPPLRIKRAFY